MWLTSYCHINLFAYNLKSLTSVCLFDELCHFHYFNFTFCAYNNTKLIFSFLLLWQNHSLVCMRGWKPDENMKYLLHLFAILFLKAGSLWKLCSHLQPYWLVRKLQGSYSLHFQGADTTGMLYIGILSVPEIKPRPSCPSILEVQVEGSRILDTHSLW